MTDHEHHVLRTHEYWNGRSQTDEPCRKRSCPGIARVGMAWAPDTGKNWLKCCCCGDEWNPGEVRYPPGVGESLHIRGLW